MRLFNASYRGFKCRVRLVEHSPEDVVTRRGNVRARVGDYVAIGVDEAPPGFRGDTIDRVIRQGDRDLIVGDEILPAPEKVRDPAPVLTEPVFGDSVPPTGTPSADPE